MIRIRQALAGTAIRQVIAIPPAETRADTVKKLKERYNFVKVPASFEELYPINPNQGIQFLHGNLPRDGKAPIFIEMLQLLPNLIIARTQSSTDDAEEFLNEYINNANKDRAETIRTFGAPLYSSEIEFQFDKDLDFFAPKLGEAARQMDALVSRYGSSAPPHYRVVSILVNFDVTGLGGAVPGFCKIERRAGVPFSEQIFFSVAPLKTRDHEELLKSLDH